MTPLHIMACSTIQNIGLYKVLIEKYPESLITKDRWGALPLLYAVWGQAPDEVVQFLVESYLSIYPSYELNWTSMFKTLGTVVVSLTEFNGLEDIIQNILDLQQESFPEQKIDWKEVLTLSMGGKGRVYSDPLRFFVKCSIKKRVNAIGLKRFRDTIMKNVDSLTRRVAYGVYISMDTRKEFQNKLQTMLGQYETEYQSLKEATTMIELVLWKKSISELTLSDDRRGEGKREFDEPGSRNQCRVSSGADIIVRNVLPYLLPS